MLYLPPHLAHWGIAVSDSGEDCVTYSIGFRAPKHKELATEFLAYLQDKLQQDENAMPGIYQDADLTLQAHAAEISSSMINKVANTLNQIQWSEDMVADFLGRYLSEPKPDVLFEPNRKVSLAQFHKKILQHGIMLDLKSQMLFCAETFYLNGEAFIAKAPQVALMQQLADTRKINGPCIADAVNESLLTHLHGWYLSGYIQIGSDG